MNSSSALEFAVSIGSSALGLMAKLVELKKA